MKLKNARTIGFVALLACVAALAGAQSYFDKLKAAANAKGRYIVDDYKG